MVIKLCGPKVVSIVFQFINSIFKRHRSIHIYVNIYNMYVNIYNYMWIYKVNIYNLCMCEYILYMWIYYICVNIYMWICVLHMCGYICEKYSFCWLTILRNIFFAKFWIILKLGFIVIVHVYG